MKQNELAENCKLIFLLIEIFSSVVFTIADVRHNGRTLVTGGSKGRIHSLPRGTIEENCTINPTGAFSPYTDPCVICRTCVTENHFARYALAAKHTGHQRSIVEADTLFLLQNIIQDREITAGNAGGFLAVVGNIFNNIVIDNFYFFERILDAFGQFGSFRYCLAGCAVINILIWTNKRSKLIFKRNFCIKRCS